MCKRVRNGFRVVFCVARGGGKLRVSREKERKAFKISGPCALWCVLKLDRKLRAQYVSVGVVVVVVGEQKEKFFST